MTPIFSNLVMNSTIHYADTLIIGSASATTAPVKLVTLTLGPSQTMTGVMSCKVNQTVAAVSYQNMSMWIGTYDSSFGTYFPIEGSAVVYDPATTNTQTQSSLSVPFSYTNNAPFGTNVDFYFCYRYSITGQVTIPFVINGFTFSYV